VLNKELKILFFIERDFHITILKPLMHYLHINSISRIGVYAPFNQDIYQSLLTNFQQNYDKDTINNLLESISIQTNPWKWEPDITLMADFSYQYVEGLGKIVNIGHGTISKGWFYSLNKISQRENCADLLCVPGEIHKERLKQQIYKNIVVTGMPKLDNCFNSSLNKDNILKKFNLDPEQKTLLLAPTFNEEFSILQYLQNCDLDFIFPDYLNLIVKLHGVSDNSEKQIFQTLKNKRQKNIYLANGYDIDELFFVSDILLSDVSSVIYEFASLNKPVILFDSPRINDYINYDKNDLEWTFRDIGYRCNDVNKIPELIFKSFTKPFKSAKQIADKFISVQDGSSTKKVIDNALQLLKDNQINPELRIFINNINDNNCKNLVQRLSSSFNISTGTKEEFFQQLNEHIFQENYLLYINSNYNLSPQFSNFMLNQIKNNSNAGIVVPLISDNEVHEQQMKFKIKFQQDLNIDQTGIQITYAFAGINKIIDFPKDYCFLINTKKLNAKTFNLDNNDNLKAQWYELITHLIKQKTDILLAYDCLISETPVLEKKHIDDDTLNNSNPKNSNISFNEFSQNQQANESIEQEESFLEKLYENPNDESIILKLIQYYYKHQLWEKLDVYADMITNNYQAQYYGIKSLEAQTLFAEALKRLETIKIDNIKDIALKCDFLTLYASIIIKSSSNDNKVTTQSPLEILNKALSIQDSHIEALLTRAIYHLTKNSLELALYDFEKVLSLDNNNPKAIKGKALILQQKGQFEEACKCYTQLLNKNPEDMETINELVKCAWETNNFREAKSALETYLEFHPANLSILFTLSGIEYKQNNFKKAIELLEKILIFDDNFLGAKELLLKIKDSL